MIITLKIFEFRFSTYEKCEKELYRKNIFYISDATTPGQSGPRSNDNEEILCIPRSSSIIEASPFDCLVSYLGQSLGEFYSSTDMQSVYSAAPANWAENIGITFSVIMLCYFYSNIILISYPLSLLLFICLKDVFSRILAQCEAALFDKRNK